MKKYIIHIISLALLTFFYGCSQEDIQATMKPGNSRTLTLTLTHAGMESRATSAGVKDLNENLIDRVDLFLYPKDGTGSDAVFSKTGITTFTSQEDGKVVINLDVPMSAVEALFPNGATICEAYAIVNRPTKSAIPTNTDMASLKAIPITSPFDSKVDEEENVIEQDEFVMDGHSTNITYANDAINGSIAAERSAAKITLTITGIEKDLTDEGGTKWIPLPGQMQVMFYNGVKTSQVNTTSVPADGVYFNLVGKNGRGFTNSEVEVEVNGVKETQTHYNHAIPFYSYPSDWGKQTPDKEAHMVLMLPWIAEGATDQTNFYYEVPIDDINKKLVRNTYYQIKLVVGVLGSTELNDEIVTLTPTCILLNWGEEQINADLDKPKYLVVDEKQVKVYNKPDCKVEYDTSDPVSVQILSITKPNYKETTAKIDNIYTYKSGGTVLSQTNGFTLTAENGVLNLNHTLDNEISDGSFDYVPYTVKVKIYHTNASTEYVEEVEFIQYPAVYVENSFNAGGNKVDKSNDDDGIDDGSEENGWVFVNSQTQSDYSGNSNNQSNYWYTVEGFDTSSNNPNMYIVTTTALDRSLNYILGDSRETTTYTYSQIGTGESKDINNATLQKYRPTKTDRDDYLSPKFRISSAYGQLGNNKLTLENAKKRCATYQEYGYPAGRWRLATKAELEYIAILCQFDALPISLFGASTYWGANDRYSIDTSDGKIEAAGSSGYAYLRCVYDDWYWGSTPLNDKTKFTWGDQKTTEELNALAK